jgi:hypothetical protein
MNRKSHLVLHAHCSLNVVGALVTLFVNSASKFGVAPKVDSSTLSYIRIFQVAHLGLLISIDLQHYYFRGSYLYLFPIVLTASPLFLYWALLHAHCSLNAVGALVTLFVNSASKFGVTPKVDSSTLSYM